MRAIAWSVWVFINLVFLSMCGFFYILCSQYWAYSGRHHALMESYINKRSPAERQHVQYYSEPESETYHVDSMSQSPKQTDAVDYSKLRQSPMARDTKVEIESQVSTQSDSLSGNDMLLAKIARHKSQVMIQMRRVLYDESSVFKARGNGSNPYNVDYHGPRGTYDNKSSRNLVCALKRKGLLEIVQSDDEPFKSLGLGVHLPTKPLFDAKTIYDSCAVVSSAGSLYGSELGSVIDKHQIVLRFNHAPTFGYEVDVGQKTSVRVVNSQVISKPSFEFLDSPLYHNINILAWDPSKYNHTMEQWYKSPDHKLFQTFFKHRLLYADTGLYLLNPASLWSLWDFIQEYIPLRIRRNPPSSGFLGLALLLPYCAHVDMFEFIPSFRITNRCHYYDEAEDMSCTFGVWHPLSAEKILMYAMNVANDTTVFRDGHIRIPGFHTLKC